MVRAAAALRDGAARRDPQRAAREEPHDTEEPALREAGRSRRISIRRCAKTNDRRHLQRPARVRRWALRTPLRPQRPARAHVSRHAESADSQSARGQPRADDARHSSSRRRSSTCSRRRGSSSWCTTGSCTSDRTDRRASTSRSRQATTGPSRRMHVPRIGARSGAGRIDAAAGLRQPEQPLVGRVADLRLRRRRRGEAAHRERRQAEDRADRPAAASIRTPGINLTGFTDNWWIGLAMLHTLFTLEHNYICDLLAHAASRLERRAALHEGAADQLRADGEDPHRRVDAGDPAAPDHQARHARELVRAGRRRLRTSLTFLDDDELLGGIVGSHADHHTAPYSLTEEFVAVYRMHPLMPDDSTFRSLDDRTRARDDGRCPRSPAGRRRRSLERITMPICSIRSACSSRAR